MRKPKQPIVRPTGQRIAGRFMVRIVRPGDRYGRGRSLIHTGFDPMVEFFDQWHFQTSPNGNEAQFVTRYYIHALFEKMERLLSEGLVLDAGISAWQLSANDMIEVFDYILYELGLNPVEYPSLT